MGEIDTPFSFFLETGKTSSIYWKERAWTHVWDSMHHTCRWNNIGTCSSTTLETSGRRNSWSLIVASIERTITKTRSWRRKQPQLGSKSQVALFPVHGSPHKDIICEHLQLFRVHLAYTRTLSTYNIRQIWNSNTRLLTFITPHIQCHLGLSASLQNFQNPWSCPA